MAELISLRLLARQTQSDLAALIAVPIHRATAGLMTC